MTNFDNHLVGDNFFFAACGQSNGSSGQSHHSQRTRTRKFHKNSVQKIASIKQASKILQIEALVTQGKPK
jgi:hypothetical protein